MAFIGTARRGFTLIEFSIVLMIIGLIVGGILVGQDLIRAAGVRAQITQIEKYNTAVNTFRAKYDALPGDMTSTTASTFGFTARGSSPGQGDGNGLLDGSGGIPNDGQGVGETAMFWVDLTTANGLNVNLIDGGFSAATPSTALSGAVTGSALDQYLPQAKLGRGNYVYVYDSGSGFNLYGISAVTSISTAEIMTSAPAMSVKQAYDIDKKIDDGIPTTGRVLAEYLTGLSLTASPFAASDSATTCWNTTQGAYSIAINNGSGVNCAISVRFQ